MHNECKCTYAERDLWGLDVSQTQRQMEKSRGYVTITMYVSICQKYPFHWKPRVRVVFKVGERGFYSICWIHLINTPIETFGHNRSNVLVSDWLSFSVPFGFFGATLVPHQSPSGILKQILCATSKVSKRRVYVPTWFTTEAGDDNWVEERI